jgi:hypothetical protein
MYDVSRLRVKHSMCVEYLYNFLSTVKPEFDPTSVPVGFVVNEVAKDRFLFQYFVSGLSVSFHLRSILILN